MNMHKVDGAEMLGIFIRKLTENWEKLCDEYLEEGEDIPGFGVLPTTNYIVWSRVNIISNGKLLGVDDELLINGALGSVCSQVDDLALKGYHILDDMRIKCNNDKAEYHKAYTILAETLATMMIDIRIPELLLDYLYLCQKICIGRYLYEIRNVITDDIKTCAEIFGKLSMFADYTQKESLKVDKSDPLSRFEIVTYDRKVIEYVGVDLDYIRSTFNAYNKAIERSRTFYVPDEIYNS